jgi:hypothetical protein
MADRIQSYKVISSGGLNSTENHLDLAENFPGSATRLVNYEAGMYGGYRRIDGYQPLDTATATEFVGTAEEAEGKVLCLAIFRSTLYNNADLLAARKDVGTNSYSFYKYLPYAGWSKLDTGTTRAMTSANGFVSVNRIRFVTFNFGDGNKIAFVDGVNPPIVFDSFTWQELTVGGAGTSTDGGGDQLVDTPSLIDVFENHIFLGGDGGQQAIVCHSAPQDPYNFNVAAGAGQLNTGFDVVQIKPFRDNMFVFGSNAIKRVSTDLTLGFLLDQVTTNVGCIAADSVLEIGGDLVFLAPDGLRPVAGTSRIGDVELETISKSIQALLVDMPADYDLDSVLVGVVVRTKSQLRYFMSDASVGISESKGIIGGLRTADQKLGWEFGELLGIRASCCTSGYIGRTEYVLHGDYNGGVYRQEQTNTFNGSGITGIYSTPYFDFGDTEVRKILRRLNTFIRSEGPLEMNVSVAYDWNDTDTAKPASYSQASSGAPIVYAGRDINYSGTNTKYGGNEKPIMSTDIQGSGYAVKVTFVTLGENSAHSIQGMVFEFSVAGRR